MNAQSRACEEMEGAIRRAHQKAAVVRALALWETWIIIASLSYLAAHFLPWIARGFPVGGQ